MALIGEKMSDPENGHTSSSPAPRWVGDGKSKDTAIFFTNASSQLEHIRMQHVFVRASRIQVVGIRYAAEWEEGYVYDVWPTADGGLLWFKVALSPTGELVNELEEALKRTKASQERSGPQPVTLPIRDIDCASMEICPACFQIRGPWRFIQSSGSEHKENPLSELYQLCRCQGPRQPSEPGERSERWPSFDFNTAVELCKCCGLEPLRSGSRWSVWFCDECKERVRELHEGYQRYIIPIGRHSLMGGFGLSGKAVRDDAEIHYFVSRWKSITEAIEALYDFARNVVADNLELLGLAEQSQIPLAQYISLASRQVHSKEAAFRRLCKSFDVEPATQTHGTIPAVTSTAKPAVGWRVWSLFSPDDSDSISQNELETPLARANRLSGWLVKSHYGMCWNPRSATCVEPDLWDGQYPTASQFHGFWDQLGTLPTSDIASQGSYCVVGQVVGWGSVVEYEFGWSAKALYPLSLALACDWCLSLGTIQPAERVSVSRGWSGGHYGYARCSSHHLEWLQQAGSKALDQVTLPACEVEAELLARYGVPRARIPAAEQDPALFLAELGIITDDDPKSTPGGI